MWPKENTSSENLKIWAGLNTQNNLTSVVVSINELIENKITQIANKSNVNMNGKYILKVNKILFYFQFRIRINSKFIFFKAFSDQTIPSTTNLIVTSTTVVPSIPKKKMN